MLVSFIVSSVIFSEAISDDFDISLHCQVFLVRTNLEFSDRCVLTPAFGSLPTSQICDWCEIAKVRRGLVNLFFSFLLSEVTRGLFRVGVCFSALLSM